MPLIIALIEFHPAGVHHSYSEAWLFNTNVVFAAINHQDALVRTCIHCYGHGYVSKSSPLHVSIHLLTPACEILIEVRYKRQLTLSALMTQLLILSNI